MAQLGGDDGWRHAPTAARRLGAQCGRPAHALVTCTCIGEGHALVKGSYPQRRHGLSPTSLGHLLGAPPARSSHRERRGCACGLAPSIWFFSSLGAWRGCGMQRPSGVRGEAGGRNGHRCWMLDAGQHDYNWGLRPSRSARPPTPTSPPKPTSRSQSPPGGSPFTDTHPLKASRWCCCRPRPMMLCTSSHRSGPTWRGGQRRVVGGGAHKSTSLGVGRPGMAGRVNF